MVFIWGHAGQRGASVGPARGLSKEGSDKKMWSSSETSSINLHMETVLCKNEPFYLKLLQLSRPAGAAVRHCRGIYVYM